MNRHFKREEMARCFRENGARCRECPLKQKAEKLPDGVEANLETLVEQGELMSYVHEGFWQCMDNVRERDMLEQLWATHKAPWSAKWDEARSAE